MAEAEAEVAEVAEAVVVVAAAAEVVVAAEVAEAEVAEAEVEAAVVPQRQRASPSRSLSPNRCIRRLQRAWCRRPRFRPGRSGSGSARARCPTRSSPGCS